MPDPEDTNITYKVTRFKGSDHYAEWELTVASTLLAKGWLDTLSDKLPTIASFATSNPKKEIKDHGKAWAVIIQSLTTVGQASLSSPARSINAPNAELLWQELESTSSATPSGIAS
jgi:hypothetical protein